MDVFRLVAIAVPILAGYLATVTNTGEIYFVIPGDMFAFFLLSGRYLAPAVAATHG